MLRGSLTENWQVSTNVVKGELGTRFGETERGRAIPQALKGRGPGDAERPLEEDWPLPLSSRGQLDTAALKATRHAFNTPKLSLFSLATKAYGPHVKRSLTTNANIKY